MASSKPLSRRELNRTLLARQMLLERKRMSAVRAVARLVALQAQWSPSPYIALWSRLVGFRKEQLYHERLVKAQSLRITLHVSERGVFADALAATQERYRGRLDGVVREAPVGPWPHHKPSPVRRWDERLPDAGEAAIRVVHAYLAAYGPATRKDIAKFTGFRMGQIDPALEGMRDRDGHWDVPRGQVVGDVPAPVRFLPAFDSIILAHADRTRIVPPDYEEIVFNKKNATVKNTFTVDGFIAGAWKIDGKRIVIEPFAPLPAKWRREVDAEGERLLAWWLS